MILNHGKILNNPLDINFYVCYIVACMGIKERRTKILMTLLLFSDILHNPIDQTFSPVNLNEQIQTIVDLTFNEKTRGTLSGLIREGSVEKISTDDSNVYRLTNKGFYEIILAFPFFRFLKDDWDGKWRILSYEIPEKKRELRDRLRREVAGWGLGPWHRSFWITPHPIVPNLRELISQKEEEQFVQAFESEHVFGDREILIEKVWQKSQLDKQYRELFKKWHEILSSSQEKNDKMKIVIDQYIGLLRVDPGLPRELLGESWIGYEGYTLFKEIRSILLS